MSQTSKKPGAAARGLAAGSILLLAAAAAVSCLGCSLFAAAVLTRNWDLLQFDFASVNASASAAASGFVQAKSLFDAGRVRVVGIVLLAANNSAACLLQLQGGLWEFCDSVDPTDSINDYYHTYCSQQNQFIRNNTCFTYVTEYERIRNALELTENSAEQQIMKMQNNAIACLIVVLLCLITSTATAVIGVFCRVVPAVMVTAVLYLTAGIFVIFSNSIQHEKVSRMMRRPQIASCPECKCYSLIKVPDQYCTDSYRTVSVGWSLILSWLAAAFQLAAAALWLYAMRRMRIDKSKTMV